MARKKRRKGLRRGNIRARGNEGGRRARERRRINARIPMRGSGKGRSGYALPVSAGTSVTAAKQQRGERPGTGPFGGWWLPPEGPPIYVGRR